MFCSGAGPAGAAGTTDTNLDALDLEEAGFPVLSRLAAVARGASATLCAGKGGSFACLEWCGHLRKSPVTLGFFVHGSSLTFD